MRVDFDTYESQSFLNGNREPLLRSLAHLAKDADRGGGRAAGGAVRRPSRRGRVPSLRKMPPQHASDATQLMYECIAAAAPGWCARLEGGAPPDAVPFRDLPLVTVDNLPPMDEQALGVLPRRDARQETKIPQDHSCAGRGLALGPDLPHHARQRRGHQGIPKVGE